jgi:hypothetical protein
MPRPQSIEGKANTKPHPSQGVGVFMNELLRTNQGTRNANDQNRRSRTQQ